MGCNCSSDYSDNEWMENLDEICEHCNCPIAAQSSNPVSVYKKTVSVLLQVRTFHTSLYECVHMCFTLMKFGCFCVVKCD